MRRKIVLAILATVVLACTAPVPSPQSPTPPSSQPPSLRPTVNPTIAQTVNPAATPDIAPSPSTSGDPRVEGWRSDIGQLIVQLEQRHPDLAQQVALPDLESAANDLSARVPTLTDDEMLVGIMGIVALVSRKGCDAHTGAYVWGGGNYAVDSLPLRLWLFGDDVYVVDALAPYESLVGQKISAISGEPTEQVVQLLEPIIPRDNDETVRLLLPRFLLIPQVLKGVGVPVASSVTLLTQNRDGVEATRDVTPIAMSAYNDWTGPYGLHLPADPNMMYLSRIDEVLWWQRLQDGALYVQSNQVQTAPLADLEEAMNRSGIDSVVLDLRNNFGGEVWVLDLMTSLFSDWLASSQSHTLEIATGRNTFSAASLLVARLANRAGVEVSGEPMGGCPSGWGNNRDFNLSYSGIPISVATTFEIGATADDPRQTIEPTLPKELTFSEWLHNSDPILEAHVLGSP